MKNVHHPVLLMSAGVRMLEMNRPNVGIVHTSAMTIAKNEAMGEPKMLFCLRLVSRMPFVLVRAGVRLTGAISSMAVISEPPSPCEPVGR